MVVIFIGMRRKAARNPDILLKGLLTDSLLTCPHPGLQQRDSDSGGARKIQRKTEFCGFRERAGVPRSHQCAKSNRD